MTDRRGNLTRFVYILFATTFLWACEGDDGAAGSAGPDGPAGPPGPSGPPGPPADDVISIGNGSGLTEEEIEHLGKLQASITGVTVSSPPVVDFTVVDQHGVGAVGIAPGTIQFTFAKLVPSGDPGINGGLAHWQSYINRARTSNLEGSIPNAIQATTDSSGTLEELGGGQYRYTFASDVTDITTPIEVLWEPGLTHRVGLEIRLSGPGEVPLAPFNPVYDFVPDGGAGSGVTKNIADTNNCAGCHFEFEMHGGPRKSVEYCVTCHNPGSVDPDSGESVDMAYLAHSIHMGADRANPYIIYGFGGRPHDYSEVLYPQSQTYCETCHEASVTHPDGNAWNAGASAKACGGCHADGLVADNFDPVTGQAEYEFDHAVAEANIGPQQDGSCNGCHLGTIATAGTALAVHSRIPGDNRFRDELGDNFILEVLGAENTAPGETPVITLRVTNPAGEPYDIVDDPEFDTGIGASMNLYVAWTTDDIYNGDESGATGSLRCTDRTSDGIPDIVAYSPAHPHRMYLDCIQYSILNDEGSFRNEDGSYTVTYFASIPENTTGDAMISIGGHPYAIGVTDANLVVRNEQAMATSTVFFPGAERELAVDPDSCNACHGKLNAHGRNRNGDVAMCTNCHNADLTDDGNGFALGVMIHSIHAASPSYVGGEFSAIKYPQTVANCDTCHVEGAYNVARESARAISIDPGESSSSWLDDFATTPTAANCGVCHTSVAALGHFNTQGGQVGVPKDEILTVGGLPNGQEACAVCHGEGSAFETAGYHNPGLLVEE